MRYEDWQKYIDSQFIDEAAEPVVPEVQPVERDVEPVFLPAHAVMPEPPAYTVANYNTAATVAPQHQLRAESKPVSPTPEPESVVLPRRMTEPRPEHHTSGIVDIEIPSIDSYLPFLRKNMAHAQPVEQFGEIPVEIPPEVDIPSPPTERVAGGVNPEIAVAGISTTIAVEQPPVLAEELASKPVGPIVETTVDEKEAPHAGLNSVVYRRTRTPKSNTRHELTEPLTLSDLWLLSPRTFEGLRTTDYSEEQDQRAELVNAICDYRTELGSNGPHVTPRIAVVHGKAPRSPLSSMRQPGETRAYRLTEAIAFIESESAKGSVQA